jgi:hypothetical protein
VGNERNAERNAWQRYSSKAVLHRWLVGRSAEAARNDRYSRQCRTLWGCWYLRVDGTSTALDPCLIWITFCRELADPFAEAHIRKSR